MESTVKQQMTKKSAMGSFGLEESMWLQQIRTAYFGEKQPYLKAPSGSVSSTCYLWQCLNPFIKEKSVLRKLWKNV
jgi:hypothetical protein